MRRGTRVENARIKREARAPFLEATRGGGGGGNKKFQNYDAQRWTSSYSKPVRSPLLTLITLCMGIGHRREDLKTVEKKMKNRGIAINEWYSRTFMFKVGSPE